MSPDGTFKRLHKKYLMDKNKRNEKVVAQKLIFHTKSILSIPAKYYFFNLPNEADRI